MTPYLILAGALVLLFSPLAAAWLADLAAARERLDLLVEIDRPEAARRRAEQAWGMHERRRP